MVSEAGYPTREGACTETTLVWQVGTRGHEGKGPKRSVLLCGQNFEQVASE